MQPDEDLMTEFLFDFSERSLPKSLIILKDWQVPYCWIVKTDRLGVLLPRGGDAGHFRRVYEMPDQIDVRFRRGWYPASFGKTVAQELSLSPDREPRNEDLFGRQGLAKANGKQCRYIVVNQHGLICTITPYGPVEPYSSPEDCE